MLEEALEEIRREVGMGGGGVDGEQGKYEEIDEHVVDLARRVMGVERRIGMDRDDKCGEQEGDG